MSPQKLFLRHQEGPGQKLPTVSIKNRAGNIATGIVGGPEKFLIFLDHPIQKN